MTIFAFIVFFISLLGILALFALKAWEARRGVVFAAGMRKHADERALALKEALLGSRSWLEKIGPLSVQVVRYMVHEGALGLAHFARSLERGAYKIADFVSHKHRFERRAPRSEFLKQVAEHKNDNGIEGDPTLE